MARPHRVYSALTPQSMRAYYTRTYECSMVRYTNNKKKLTDRSDEEKMECSLDEENNSLEKPVPGILQN